MQGATQGSRTAGRHEVIPMAARVLVVLMLSLGSVGSGAAELVVNGGLEACPSEKVHPRRDLGLSRAIAGDPRRGAYYHERPQNRLSEPH
jgi:hypothetical protein